MLMLVNRHCHRKELGEREGEKEKEGREKKTRKAFVMLDAKKTQGGQIQPTNQIIN